MSLCLIIALALIISPRVLVAADATCACRDGYGTDEDHIVQVDADGEFLRAHEHKKQQHATERLDDLFNCIKESGRTRIILYVHGGRVSLGSAVKTAKKLSPIIAKEKNEKGKKDTYPIFFCWDTEEFNSYFRHLAYERNGVSYRGSCTAPTAALGAPLVLAADIGRGVTRLPINTTLSFAKLLQNSDLILGRNRLLFPVKKKYEEQVGALAYPLKPRKAIHDGFTYPPDLGTRDTLHVALGQDSAYYQLKFAIQEIATLPLQFTTEPVIDTVGTPAWGNMLRRTRSMFHPSINYVAQCRPSPSPIPGAGYVAQATPCPFPIRGAGTEFFGRLQKFLSDTKAAKLEIYAHSMGTIVINEAYATFPDLQANLIVFMAAACSIREFGNTTGRYIAKNNVPLYNLSLHPRAELDDTEVLGLPVRGSLLVWIDEFFEDPKSFGDRTLGNFENIIIAQDFLPKSAPIYLKAFAIEDGSETHDKRPRYRGPQRHGEFDSYYFWRPQFRSTSQANDHYQRVPD